MIAATALLERHKVQKFVICTFELPQGRRRPRNSTLHGPHSKHPIAEINQLRLKTNLLSKPRDLFLEQYRHWLEVLTPWVYRHGGRSSRATMLA